MCKAGVQRGPNIVPLGWDNNKATVLLGKLPSAGHLPSLLQNLMTFCPGHYKTKALPRVSTESKLMLLGRHNQVEMWNQ